MFENIVYGMGGENPGLPNNNIVEVITYDEGGVGECIRYGSDGNELSRSEVEVILHAVEPEVQPVDTLLVAMSEALSGITPGSSSIAIRNALLQLQSAVEGMKNV